MLRLIHNQQGATSIEYAFICCLIVMVMLVGLRSLGDGSTRQINHVQTEIENHM